MLASVSSHVGRLVGRSFDFQLPEKPDFSQHEQDFLHKGHGFSRHEHEFSREPLLHEPLSMIGGSAVGRLPCDSAGVQMVEQLPARVVELLQSSVVGEPRQDHRLCQNVSGTFSAASPATLSGPGPAQQSALCISSESLRGMSSESLRGMSSESLLGMSSESLLGMSSESLLGMSVGRSVGRSGGCAGVRFAVSQCAESPDLRETPWPELPPDTLGHHCCDAPGHQVEAQSAEGGGSHLRSAVDFGPLGSRVEHGGGIDAEILSPVYVVRGGMVNNASTGPRTKRVAKVLPLMCQGRNTRSLGHRCTQQGDHQLEASGMPSVGHHPGEVYRHPEIGDDLAGLPARLHEGTGPCSQRTSITGRVVPFFEPEQVRRSDPQRSGGSDGGVIVGGSLGFNDASLDKSWRYMDGATATAPGAESWRYMDKATATAPRAEENIAESDVGRGDHGRGDSGAPEEETTAKDHGDPPPGCIRESAAKDSTKGFRSFGIESKGFGSSGIESARDSTKAAGGTAYATTPDIGATSPTTTPDFRAASSATTPGVSTIAPTDGGPWSSLRLDCSLCERQGDLLLPFGGELFHTGKDGAGRHTGARTLGTSSSTHGRCLTQRSATSNTPRTSCSSKDDATRTSGTRDDATRISGNSCSTSDQLSDPWIRSNTTSASRPEDGFGTSALEKPSASVGRLPEIPSEFSTRPSALYEPPPREHAKEASFECNSVGRCDHGAIAAPMPLQDTSIFDEPNELHEAGRPGDPATELAVDIGHSSADPVVTGESKKALDHRLRGHVPFWGSCEYCSRARGITPARKRPQGHPHEMQLDQCVYKHRFFVVLVHVATFAIAVNHRPEGTTGTETADGLRDWCMHFGVSREQRPHFLSDPEPLAISIAERLAESHNGTSGNTSAC